MASFEEILKQPASDFKPPQALPVGTYHCMVEGPLERGASSQKQTPFLEAKFKILAPYKDVDPEQAAEAEVVGKVIRNPYYVTEGSTYRLSEMLEHLGIELEGKGLEEAIAEAPGKQLLVTLKHEASPDGTRVFHRVNSTAHV